MVYFIINAAIIEMAIKEKDAKIIVISWNKFIVIIRGEEVQHDVFKEVKKEELQ